LSRKQQLRTSTASIAPVLITRKNAAIICGAHPSTLWRMEKEGILQPIKLTANPKSSTVYYRIDAIERVVQGKITVEQPPLVLSQEVRAPETARRPVRPTGKRRGRPRKFVTIERKRLQGGG